MNKKVDKNELISGTLGLIDKDLIREFWFLRERIKFILNNYETSEDFDSSGDEIVGYSQCDNEILRDIIDALIIDFKNKIDKRIRDCIELNIFGWQVFLETENEET